LAGKCPASPALWAGRFTCLPTGGASGPYISMLKYKVVEAALPAYRKAGVAALIWEPTEGLPYVIFRT